ncbi:MAG: sensor histidine kinase [Lachnospiraceae bacterium]|nr:sensor histidine kinase [Lachnospiraceae bacterium]
MKRGKRRLRHLYDRLLGMRLCYQMALLYIIGGALPVILIGMYLIQGTSRILMEREMQAELSELDRIGREADSLFSTVNSLSKTFYFDEKLEHIAEYQYQEYQEIVDDYRDYTAFNTMRNLYSRLLHYITIYMENDTIVENAHFQKVDKQLHAKGWYQQVLGRGGGAVWQYLPFHLDQQHYLALTRLLRTQKAENVGVLAIYLRPERLEEILGTRKGDVCIVLNQEEILMGAEGQAWYEDIRGILKNRGTGTFQEQTEVRGQEYLLTCIAVSSRETEDIFQIVSMKSYRDILRQVNGQNRRSIYVFLGSVLLSVTMIWLFSRAFSGRVNRFRRQMQKAASGDFNLEESLGGNDEISELYGYLWSMILDIQRLLAEIYQERIHAEQLYARQKEAEFKMLASQINPHFLYNTLETIRMKARVNHQPEIEELVKMLAKILRNNVRAGDRDVTLGQELDLVESYLKIQQYRFDERLEYEISTEDGLKEEKMLPLILQPIVENSIIHGLESKEGVGHIRIRARREKEDFLVIVEDDGIGISSEVLERIREGLNSRELNRPHIGVSNVHQRLRLKYGNGYGLVVESEEGCFTRVAVRIPTGGNRPAMS